MRKYLIFVLLLLPIFSNVKGQEIKVLTLGTFHFAYHNKDVQKTESKDQIDVLKPEYQDEIELIVRKIAKFEPTIIAIEIDPDKQSKIDSLYKAYITGKHLLKRSETEQIGFRLAKHFKLKTLYCVNDWGKLPDDIQEVVYGDKTVAQDKFMDYFYNNSDSTLIYDKMNIYQTEGILAELRERNSNEFLKKDLGNYFISIFKYETKGNAFFGVDFTTGWFFNRNLKIFRNIQKIPTKPNDRILVIYGSGHMSILNILFDASPEYELIPAIDYLR